MLLSVAAVLILSRRLPPRILKWVCLGDLGFSSEKIPIVVGLNQAATRFPRFELSSC